MYNRFAAHYFTTQNDIPFCPDQYSRFKFGSNELAKQFGYELAQKFFDKHADLLLSNKVVVFASPYNFVQNAASIMANHFVHKLNRLLVNANGQHVETSVIHRRVTYVNDYGFLSKEKRKSLISNDTFYLNKKFIKGKVLLFLDDIRITGTHEDKLIELIQAEKLTNNCMFLYYAELLGDSVGADIEAYLNLHAIKSPQNLLSVMEQEGAHYNLIVRPIKYLMGQPAPEFLIALHAMPKPLREELYYSCLGEGYYCVPAYQTNFIQLSTCI
ncbi:phosphoribosyltransferase family protein [Spirosoma foliorum]|uniref:Uncharacterized protein n=1 Tax=Spirosoma foliorum TaxID=2710596 RepID=A0A7G5H2J8_9BACT|nr:phosphoribosyltransferase family protein [Spirosoma foliorum]QMW05340.1 hypothetical protein H3H32_10845 [Spirosoma foliorum]